MVALNLHTTVLEIDCSVSGYNVHNDIELLSLIKQGNEEAFALLFNRHKDKVFTIALKLTRSKPVAEEIVEDVFLIIWLKRSQSDKIDNFNAYLHTITRNETYRILKQIARTYKIVLSGQNKELPDQNNTEDVIVDKEMTSLLQQAIDQLPKQQKKVYQLIKEEELKRKDVAKILNLKPETVKFYLAEAMKNIRSFFQQYLKI